MPYSRWLLITIRKTRKNFPYHNSYRGKCPLAWNLEWSDAFRMEHWIEALRVWLKSPVWVFAGDADGRSSSSSWHTNVVQSQLLRNVLIEKLMRATIGVEAFCSRTLWRWKLTYKSINTNIMVYSGKSARLFSERLVIKHDINFPDFQL